MGVRNYFFTIAGSLVLSVFMSCPGGGGGSGSSSGSKDPCNTDSVTDCRQFTYDREEYVVCNIFYGEGPDPACSKPLDSQKKNLKTKTPLAGHKENTQIKMCNFLDDEEKIKQEVPKGWKAINPDGDWDPNGCYADKYKKDNVNQEYKNTVVIQKCKDANCS